MRYATLLMHECCFARANCRCTLQGQCTFVLRHVCLVHIALFTHVLSFTVRLLFDPLLSYASFIFFVRINILTVTCLYLFLFVCFWLITSHKSIPDLGIDPSRASVKLLRATLGISARNPSFLFGGLKGPEGSSIRELGEWRTLHVLTTHH